MRSLFVTVQYLLPHHLLCRVVYALTRVRIRWLKNLLIDLFVRAYQPQMTDAAEPVPRRYESFNAFFTRALRADARPIDPTPGRIVSPCDGTLSVADSLAVNRLVQAKGHDYSLEDLIAAERQYSDIVRGGSYATIYLAPYNYHRLHMPAAGRLRAAWYVPGRLFSVNSTTVTQVPNLFASNERVVCLFDGDSSGFILVLVGALFVGSMSTVWHGEITPWRGPARRARRARRAGLVAPFRLEPREHPDLWLARGAEFARFNMGSTIVMLFPPQAMRWDRALQPGLQLRVGQGIGALALPSKP